MTKYVFVFVVFFAAQAHAQINPYIPLYATPYVSPYYVPMYPVVSPWLLMPQPLYPLPVVQPTVIVIDRGPTRIPQLRVPKIREFKPIEFKGEHPPKVPKFWWEE